MKIAKWVLQGLLALVMLVALFVIVAPHFGGWQFEAILSGSMSPALKTGDLVVALPVSPYAIQVGDIIVYHLPRDPDTLIVHRVVDIEQSNPLSFQTKGDANPSPDAYLVPAHNVLGKVRLHLPWLGHFTRFAQSTLGFILLLVIPGAIIIVSEFSNLKNLLTKKDVRGEAIITGSPQASLPEPSPTPSSLLSEGLKITPGSLQGTQFIAQTDAKGEVISLDYGKVPPGYSQLSGDTLRLRNLTEGTLKVSIAISGGISQFCRDLKLTITSWTMERKLRDNPLILHQGEEARLEISLFVPFSTKNLGSHQGEMRISVNNGAMIKRIQLFITISNPEVSI